MAVYNTRAAKRAVNLSLNEDLVAEARKLTGNLSAEVENLLAGFVTRERRAVDEKAESLRRCAQVSNAFLERAGSLSDEFSTL